MIASVTITPTGNELTVDGRTVLYAYQASGREIIDVLYNGDSIDNWQDHTDNTYGSVSVPIVTKGDYIEVIYKSLPRVTTTIAPVIVDYTEGDYEAADYS